MILRWRLTLAHYLDRWEQRARRVLEHLGWPQAWLAEFIAYRGDPRMTIEEFWVRYVLLRIDAETKWFQPTMSEAEARRFYEKHDYMLWRNLVHRRHVAWRRVQWTMKRQWGALLEFGCGVAPVSAWVGRHRPGWIHALEDIDGPAYRYARWRVPQYFSTTARAVYRTPYDVITALDVFEHLAEPEKAARDLVDRLLPGGLMHWNIHHNPSANDLDLASKEQLDATARYLESVLDVVWAKDEYRVGRKP